MRRAFWIFWLLAVSAAIIYLSADPIVQFPPGADKIAHVMAYGTWTAIALMIVRRWITSIAVLIAVLAFGIGIEFVQPYLGHICSVRDMVANAIGVVAGALLAIFAIRPTEKRFLDLLTKPEIAGE